MRIYLISGSRSDWNALEMVARSLRLFGEYDTSWVNCRPALDAVSRDEAAANTAGQVEFARLAMMELRPDMVFVHGDRHEVLGAAVAANVMGVPIAHIGGGDLTEGSQDDSFRHAITKLSHLHFASNQDSADRIIQMGEEPDRVHVTGCPGIDMVMAMPVLGREETFAAVGLATPARSLVVLFHPNTLADTRPELEALSVALARRTEALVLLGPNADAGGDLIRREWQRLVRNRPDTVYHDNVEPQVFYSLLKWCDALVGNSSAGFYEAPCFGIPVINISDRQKGRMGWNIATVPADTSQINDAIKSCIDAPKSIGPGLYGDGHAAERIAKVIGGIKDPRALLRKKFIHTGYNS